MSWNSRPHLDKFRPTIGAPRLEISKPTSSDFARTSTEFPLQLQSFQPEPLYPSKGTPTSTPRTPPPPPPPLKVQRSRKFEEDFDYIRSNSPRNNSYAPAGQQPSQDCGPGDHRVYQRAIGGLSNATSRFSSFFDHTEQKKLEQNSSSKYSSRSPSIHTPRGVDTNTGNGNAFLTKSTLAIYCIMGIVGVMALAALVIGATALAKGQHIEGKLQTTTSDVQSVTPTTWQTWSMTGEDDTTTSVMPVISQFTPVESTTQTSSSTKTSKTTSRTTSHPLTTDDSIQRNSSVNRREEALVVDPDDECESVLTITTTGTIYQTSIEPSQTSSIFSTTLSNFAARRFHAPFAWAHLRRFWLDSPIDQPIESIIPVPTEASRTERDEDAAENLVNVASSNAAVPQMTLPWMFSRTASSSTLSAPINRRGNPGRKIVYWEAYSQLHQEATQLCFAAKTYQDPAQTPSFVKNTDDDHMAAMVNEKLCSKMGKEFASVDQGQECDTKNEWEGLKKAVEDACKQEMIGKVVVQSLTQLCGVKTSLEGNIDECGGDGKRSLGTSSGGTAVLSTQSMTTLSSVVLSKNHSMASNFNWPHSSVAPASSLLQRSAPVVTVGTSLAASPIAAVTSQPTPSSPLASSSLSSSGEVPGTAVARLSTSIPVSSSSPLITSSPVPPTSPSIAPSTTTAANGPPPTLPATTCPPSASQLTFATPAPWSAAILTSILPWTASFTPLGLSSHGISPHVGIPCGYSATHGADPTVIPTVAVPVTTQIGELTLYNGSEAFINPPSCGPENVRLQPHEAAVAIGWELFDYGAARTSQWTKNAFCGRKMVAWCETDKKGDGKKERSEVMLWVRDRCSGCRVQDIDVLEDVYPFCTHVDVGRAPVTWSWAEDGVAKTQGA